MFTRGKRAAWPLTVVVAVVAALSLSACSSAAKPDVVPSADDVEPAVVVHVVDNAYQPANVEIEPGDAVQWVFEGNMQHDVVADDGSFVSDLVYEGTYTYVFEEAGEFEYDCSIHPEMRGSVTVK